MKPLASIVIVVCALAGHTRAQNSATQPSQPTELGQIGLAQYFQHHTFAYEPMYALAGGPAPAAMVKFQFSFRYQPFTVPEESPASFINLINFAYSQTSLWDIRAESSPFKDSSYRPEFFLFKQQDVNWPGNISNFIWQAGFKHESNGKDDPDSRSMNRLYAQVGARFGKPGEVQLTVAPRLWMYVMDLEDNPDIYHYRGYGDLQAKVLFPNDLMLAATLMMGNEWDKGSIQVDISYPLHKVTDFDVFLYGQFFNGFGESLIDYNESTNVFRIGLAVVR